MTAAISIDAYNATRAPDVDRSVLCHAPFVSLNFDQSGNVTACCYNRDYVLGKYPEQSIQQIWSGEPAQALRKAFRTGSHAPGCDRCFDQLRDGNFAGALMRNFDRFAAGPPRPSDATMPPLVLEFELSNTCSLECVMCGGHWSSAIRAKREKLPPLANPYDDAFLEQITALLPSVVMAKFLGGEPFLIKQYHAIWARLGELNPQAEISITTSGAVVPERPRALLDSLRAHLVVSLDGITKDTYEAIRQNARFETVMASIDDFQAYTHRQGTSLTVACCPMAHNWHELAAIVDFCEARQLQLFFNTVTYPLTASLAGFSESELARIVTQLDHDGSPAGAAERGRPQWGQRARDQWSSLMNQLQSWLNDKREVLQSAEKRAQAIRVAVERASYDLQTQQAASIIDTLALAHQVELERGTSPITTDLLRKLPTFPLTLPGSSATEASPQDLIVAAHAFWRFSAKTDAPVPDEIASRARQERQRLTQLFAWANEREELASRLTTISARIRRDVERGTTRAVTESVRHLIDRLEVDDALNPDDILMRLDQDGRDDRSKVQGYVADLMLVKEGSGGPTPEDEPDLLPHRGFSSAEDLNAALYAMQLVHESREPADRQDEFRRRLDAVRAGISGGLSEAALQALSQVTVNDIYSFVKAAPDDEFARAVAQFS